MKSEYITPEEESEYLAYHNYQDVIDNYESGLQSLDNFNFQEYQGKVSLICGAMVAFDKGLANFLNVLQRKEGNFFLLSEVTAQYRRYTKEKINMPFICTPHLLAKEILILGMDIPTTEAMQELCKRKRYVKDAVANMEGRHQNLGSGYAVAWGYYAYSYLYRLLQGLKPQKVILWNEFYAFHMILGGICKEMGIPVSYMEFGCIPGTICIEEKGQQGESLPARRYLSFFHKKVSRNQIGDADCSLVYLRNTGLNRNVQPEVKLSAQMLNYYKSGRKTITYLGQNDYESGLYPYTRKSKRYHSPCFKSSLEGLEYLHLLAIKNDWNLIYKPHPLMVALGHDTGDKGDVDVISEVDINSVVDFSDLLVTILSQGAYIALIRKRPVLMLGYTQLRGKGCTYQAFCRFEIERQIKKALKLGYTEEQENNFKKHVAQLYEYYLYDDLTHEEYRFGRRD